MTLSEIALRAKASHGYPREWLAEWKEDLTLTSAFINANPVFLAETEPGGDIVGVVALEDGADGPEIAHLWVRPERQGRGFGRALFRRAVDEARSRGWREIRILSDPNVRTFYERMGAVRVGTHPAPVAGMQRELPVLSLPIDEF